jgi:hypothetical protein
VSSLGAKSIKLSDGTTDPRAGDLVAGGLYNLWYDGTNFRLLSSESRQTGAELLCASASGSATAYTCAMTPALAAYTTGMVLRWKPDVSAAGGAATLNVSSLGAKSIKLSDGTTDPRAGDLVAGGLYNLWYDGTNFRLLSAPGMGESAPASRPTCDSTRRGRLWMSLGASGTKDELAVCAKAADNTYAWRTLY